MKKLQISYDLVERPALLELYCRQSKETFIRNASMQLQGWKGGRKFITPIIVNGSAQDNLAPAHCDHLPVIMGSQDALSLKTTGLDLGGCLYLFQDVDRRYLFSKIRIVNNSKHEIVLDRIEMMTAGDFDGSRNSLIQFSRQDRHEDMAFFSNGWQSWSFSGAYGGVERQRKSSLRCIPNAVSSNPDTPYTTRKGHFSGDYFGILGNRKSRKGLLAGFLSQKQQYGSLEALLRGANGLKVWANCDAVCLRPGDSLDTDWFLMSWLDLDDPTALEPYYRLVANVHGIQQQSKAVTGWCSWYQFYTDINEQLIQQNIDVLSEIRSELPLELIQIDDGFQSAGGDWFDFTDGFPNGVEPLAREIKQHGLNAGLWLAPFIVSKGAKLIKAHPDFLLRSRFNIPINAGFISNKFSTALDISYEPALNYACGVVEKAVKDWGFDYLKLDFLYAGALPGKRYDRTKTRAQILWHALTRIREAAGKSTYLVGCGLPLGSGVGLFDAVRIGADTSETWKPRLFNIPLLFENDPQLPSARNAIQNTITRSGMHNLLWVNDPDCLLIRPHTDLTEEEVKAQATLIALSGGSLLLSDDLSGLPPERQRIASCMLPLIGRRPWVIDWFDRLTPQYLRLDLKGAVGRWHLLAFFNWADQVSEAVVTRKAFHLEQGDYMVYSFWGSHVQIVKGGTLWREKLPPHSVLLLAVRSFTGQQQYVGSDLHISQGLEVKDWVVRNGSVQTTIDLGRKGDGFIDFYLPSDPLHVKQEGIDLDVKALGSCIYRVALKFEKTAHLSIRCT